MDEESVAFRAPFLFRFHVWRLRQRLQIVRLCGLELMGCRTIRPPRHNFGGYLRERALPYNPLPQVHRDQSEDARLLPGDRVRRRRGAARAPLLHDARRGLLPRHQTPIAARDRALLVALLPALHAFLDRCRDPVRLYSARAHTRADHRDLVSAARQAVALAEA